jgi:hypothetical protein
MIWISIRFNQITGIREWYSRNSLQNVCYKLPPNNAKKYNPQSKSRCEILIFILIEYGNRCESQLTISGDAVAKLLRPAEVSGKRVTTFVAVG